MSDNLPQGLLRIAPGYRLQWEQAQETHVLLYPEGMVKLSESAAEILKLCDGQRDLVAIIADLQAKFPQVDLTDDVREFAGVAYARGWISEA